MAEAKAVEPVPLFPGLVQAGFPEDRNQPSGKVWLPASDFKSRTRRAGTGLSP